MPHIVMYVYEYIFFSFSISLSDGHACEGGVMINDIEACRFIVYIRWRALPSVVVLSSYCYILCIYCRCCCMHGWSWSAPALQKRIYISVYSSRAACQLPITLFTLCIYVYAIYEDNYDASVLFKNFSVTIAGDCIVFALLGAAWIKQTHMVRKTSHSLAGSMRKTWFGRYNVCFAS